jgi:hypothetical protein
MTSLPLQTSLTSPTSVAILTTLEPFAELADIRRLRTNIVLRTIPLPLECICSLNVPSASLTLSYYLFALMMMMTLLFEFKL